MLLPMSLSFSTAKATNGLGFPMSSFAESRLMPALAAVRSIAIAVVGFLFGLLLAAMALPVAAHAAPPQAAPATPAPVDNDATTVSIVVYGDDPCPKGKDNEIVVCAREPEGDRYRIPKRFRGKKADPAANNSWANKSRSLEDASRYAAGVPDSCSMVGTGGQSGCYHQFITQSAAQRRQQKDEAADADSSDGTPQN